MSQILPALRLAAGAFGAALLIAASATGVKAQTRPTVTIGATDIGGVVSGPKGPEAGVWVIAETTDLPTKFARTVVTDERGRYLIPDLPAAGYKVWVRGYGLVDSPKQGAKPGQSLDHRAVPAPDAAAAAHYYPAIYWYQGTLDHDHVGRRLPSAAGRRAAGHAWLRAQIGQAGVAALTPAVPAHHQVNS